MSCQTATNCSFTRDRGGVGVLQGGHHKNGISASRGCHEETNSVKISAAKPTRPGILLIKPSASMWLHLSRCMGLQLFELPCTSFIYLVSYENKVGIFYCQNAKVSELISHGHTRMLIRPLHSLFQHLAEEATCIWTASNIWIQFRLCVWRSLVRPAALFWWSSSTTGFIYRVFAAKTGRRITWKMKIEVGFFDWPGGNSSKAERCADAAHDWLLIQKKDDIRHFPCNLNLYWNSGMIWNMNPPKYFKVLQ